MISRTLSGKTIGVLAILAGVILATAPAVLNAQTTAPATQASQPTIQASQPTIQASQPKDLLEDFVGWQYSTDGGKTFSSDAPTVRAGDKDTKVLIKLALNAWRQKTAPFYPFHERIPKDTVELVFVHGVPLAYSPKFGLNGKPINSPLEKMAYRTIPIDPGAITHSINEFTGELLVPASKKDVTLAFKPAMLAMLPEHLEFQTGPVLGAAGEDYFTVTCRTNLPASVKLTCVPLLAAAEQSGRKTVESVSPVGRIHRFRVECPGTVNYHLTATCGNTSVSYSSGMVCPAIRHDPALKRKVSFVAFGDNRPDAAGWGKICDAVLKEKPDFVVHTGDLVSWGKDDSLWDNEFAKPAAKLLASVPFYAVIGNHEDDAPMYDELFYAPTKDGRGRNWSQTIGPVLLVGIDGKWQDWSKDGKNAKWLDDTLKDSKAKFIFLANHYPGYSSAGHGAIDAKGQPKEAEVRSARDVILPILEKHKATAMLVGHDHCYERSEPPGGVSCIITGGAGKATYKKTDNAEKQNPYSKVFAMTEHYCLFEISGDTCTMKAIDLAGKVIDTVEWKARNP